MADPARHPDLDAALRGLAAHVAFPDPPDVAATVRLRLTGGAPTPAAIGLWRRPSTRRLLAVAAAVLLVVAAVTAAVPRARHAVADRLGLRGVEVRVVPSTSPPGAATTTAATTAPATTVPFPAGLDLGRPTTLAEAASASPDPLLVPPQAPTGVFVDDVTHEVNLTFAGGVLLGQFPNAVPLFEKRVEPDAETIAVSVDGGRGLWLPDETHVFVEVGRGAVLAESRLAGPTLIWERGDVTLRVEGLPTLAEALAFAGSLRPYAP